MPELIDNRADRRYEMNVDGHVAYVTYALGGERIRLIHTEVPSAINGRGVGSTLAKAVLEDVRRRGLRVIPDCEFIAGYIQRHPEFTDLLEE